MEIILTEEEKAVDNWLGWDDETIGRAVRAFGLILAEDKPNHTLYAHAAALMLCKLSSEWGSNTTVMQENGVHSGSKQLGNYRITIEHSDTPWDAGQNPVHADWDGDKLISVGYVMKDGVLTVPEIIEPTPFQKLRNSCKKLRNKLH